MKTEKGRTVRVKQFYLLLIPLLLSSFTHLWNPVGFPDLFYDEGVYMRRAMHVLEGLGPQEFNNYYDHPFFGQLFLAGIFKLTNYPDSVEPSVSIHSIESLYLFPRVIMGILAIIDTFLIYKIAEKQYNKKVAIIASMLFAVMPLTWITRRILLDSILLPFLLLAVLFAIQSARSRRRNFFILLSGVCLGIAIFTKIPAVTMIPIVTYLIMRDGLNRDRSKQAKLKALGLWIIPVILIPTLWPLESIVYGNFDSFIRTVVWQTQRSDVSIGLPWITGAFILFDPALFILSILGGIYATRKKEWLILLWTIPYLVFLILIGQTNYFYWTALLPVFCIVSAVVLVEWLPRLVTNWRVSRILVSVITWSVLLFGLTTTIAIITNDISLSQRQAAVYVVSYLADHDETDMTVISSPTYSWMFKYIFKADNVLVDFRDVIFYPIATQNWILVVDPHYKKDMETEPSLKALYDQGRITATFSNDLLDINTIQYPYTNFMVTQEGEQIEILIMSTSSGIKPEIEH